MTKENKKVRNATPIVFNGIHFRSILERNVYKKLLNEGYEPEYEKHSYIIWKGLTPTVPFYDIRKVRGKPIRKNHLNMSPLSDMEYTPDFVFKRGNTTVIIEAKGEENDQFPIRKKLFRAYLETVKYPVVYAEIFTLRQLEEFLAELNNYN